MSTPTPDVQTNPAVFSNYYEAPPPDPIGDEIWCYSDRPCYACGDMIAFHVSTTAGSYSIEIARDTSQLEVLFTRDGLPGLRHPTPPDASVVGCGWPVGFEFEIPMGWSSGAYRVTCRISTRDGGSLEQHHMFLLRSDDSGRRERLLLISATGTWCAYNNWGGSNHYEGITGAGGRDFSPILSLQRPLPRGFVVLPDDAPRAALAATPDPDDPISYPHMEWAYANGYSKKYASAGWASYEKHFVKWAAQAGFDVDIASQYDLQLCPQVVEDYPCLVFIGHDEYWSWEMRDTVDAYVEAGGRIARFAGNFMWQTRLEGGGRQQVCYKSRAKSEDPMRDTQRITTSWELAQIERPGALTFGLNAIRGVYAGWGGCVAFGAAGFPIYRPEHWAFEGTGLGYGDVLGAKGRVFAYEVDGLDYVIRDGLPYPSGREEVLEGSSILALGLASNIEVARNVEPTEMFLGSEDCELHAEIIYGEATAETIALAGRGSGMIVSVEKGRGEIFHAGSVEWVAGLLRRDTQVERVTTNVLRRFLS
ncbi:MAG: hypothetical protein GY935_08230 [Gammaproteobacteria bacterium]|nr:hypothetical protein [Gammaproteobacteria bacterium]